MSGSAGCSSTTVEPDEYFCYTGYLRVIVTLALADLVVSA